MSEHEQKNDPWASLAESLGAKPAATPAAQPAPRPAAAAPTTPPRPPQKPREDRPAPAVRSDWGGLASSLGLEPAAGSTTGSTASSQTSRPQPPKPQLPAAPAPRATDEPPARRSEREQDEFSFSAGERRPAGEPAQRQSRAPAGLSRREGGNRDGSDEASRPRPVGERSEGDSRDRSETDSAPRADREDEQGEGRGRRRRGRRGGRGRGRREEGRDRPLPALTDEEQPAGRRPTTARDHDGFDERQHERQDPLLDEPSDRVSQPLEAVGDDHGGDRQEQAGDSDRDADGAPRRRRRRGRRGGRRRGRGDREGDVGTRPQADREGGEPAREAADGSARFADQDNDDEPLPSGYGSSYGVRSPARPAADSARPDASRHDGGEPSGTARTEDRESGESGGRRRRRRRRGEGRSRDARGTAAPAEGSREGSSTRRSSEGRSSEARSSEERGRRGRRGRRSAGEERRSASTFDRGRRDEFAPVAGGREEDDEGLEFLGIEDASHDGRGRDDRHPSDDDDSIVESGLNEVLDVPSWVEAIGIVIAGNLDARSRSPRGGDGGGRGGEPRGDSSARGGSSDRPRDSRRGGRSGNQR